MNFAGDLGIADGGRPILGHVLRPSSGPLLSWQAGLLADFTRLRVLSQRGAVRAWTWALFLENSSAKLGVPLDDDNDEKLKSFPSETLDDEALSTLHTWYVTKLGQKKAKLAMRNCSRAWMAGRAELTRRRKKLWLPVAPQRRVDTKKLISHPPLRL